jgi:hypothetical protein
VNFKIPYWFPLLIIAFFFLLLFPFPESETTFNWNSTCDALHLPLFFILNIGLYNLLKKLFLNKIEPAITSSLFVFILGLLIEIIQPYFNRGFSFKDIGVNLLGVFLSFLYVSNHKKILPFATAFSLLAVGIPIYNSYQLYKYVISSFPIIFDPNTVLLELASPVFESDLIHNGADCDFKVVPSKSEYSGIKIDLGYTNWTNFKYLKLEIRNPNDEILDLTLRLDDNGDIEEYNSRYNDAISIGPKQTLALEIPLSIIERHVTNRKFNLQSMSQALIFPSNSAMAFCVGKINLK